MDLDKIYLLAQNVEAMVSRKELNREDLDDFVIRVEVSPAHHYGIEKRFYEETTGSSAGFVPSEDDIHAIINDVPFIIAKKMA